MNSSLGISGYVKEFIDGELINEQHNTIDNEFKEMINKMMFASSGVNYALDSFFSTDNWRNADSGNEYGNDGIVVKDGNYTTNPYFTMVTTEENLNYNTYGVQWKGVMVASEDRSITELVIGRFLSAGDVKDDIFAVDGNYAYIDKSASPVSLVTSQTYEVLWGIYVN